MMNSLDSTTIATYLATGIPFLLLVYHWFGSHSLRHIPTVGGPSAPLLSYIGAYNYVHHARVIIQEGYEKYKGGIFKVPMMDRWLVVVTGPKMVDELQRFSDEQVSFTEAVGELSSVKYTLGRSAEDNPYHITVIRNQLTRQLAVLFPEVGDEIVAAFGDLIQAPSDGWLKVDALTVMRQIVGRVSNRVFLGLPLCRNEGYLQLAINFTMDVGKGRAWIGLFPNILKPLVAMMVSRLHERIETCLEYLRETIDERLEKMRKYGQHWPDKPNDMLQWLMDEEYKNGHFSARNIAQRVLIINFAAIHTSSNSFTHALYHLAANPELLEPLREEIEAIVEVDGWTKTAIGKMRKLDSFMRESQRMNGINTISVMRKALQDLRFSSGTFIPAGTTLVAAATSTHMDEDNYTNPDVFDPWRFADMREEKSEVTKHQFVSTSVDYMSFGHGKHACPGRFFAANELKAMMAHLVLNYDVKFEVEGVRPPNKWFGLAILPDPSARVLFRKRRIQ